MAHLAVLFLVKEQKPFDPVIPVEMLSVMHNRHCKGTIHLLRLGVM